MTMPVGAPGIGERPSPNRSLRAEVSAGFRVAALEAPARYSPRQERSATSTRSNASASSANVLDNWECRRGGAGYFA
jgi:hypothetical protein